LETAVSTSFPGMIDLTQEDVVVKVGVVGVHVMKDKGCFGFFFERGTNKFEIIHQVFV
jgi:hypothetical protein